MAVDCYSSCCPVKFSIVVGRTLSLPVVLDCGCSRCSRCGGYSCCATVDSDILIVVVPVGIPGSVYVWFVYPLPHTLIVTYMMVVGLWNGLPVVVDLLCRRRAR